VVADAVNTPEVTDALASAWRIHDAHLAWTSQVDSKASFVLAIETAIAAGVVALAGNGRRLSDLPSGWPTAYFVVGCASLVLALISVSLVVRPRLRIPHLEEEARTNFIFFGHARRWKPDELAAALRTADMVEMVSRQVVAMATVAWRKHRYLQVSLTLAIAGTALIGVAAAMNG